MKDGSSLAFVAGATGYTGREVVRIVASEGHRAVAHVRPDSARLTHWTSTFERHGAEVDSTPWEEAAMSERLTELQPAVVFSLLGTTRKRANQDGLSVSEAYEKIDYGLTALLIAAAVSSGANPRFVYLSTAGLSETTRNPYMRARVRAEADLRDSGLPFTIVRPSFITGSDREESRPGERVGAAVGDALLGFAGALGARRLRDRYASMTATELATGLVRAAFDPGSENSVLHADELR